MKRLVAGPNAVEEALKGRTSVSAVYLHEGLKPSSSKHFKEMCKRIKVPWELLNKEALDTLSKGLRHQGVIALTGDYPYRDLETILTNLPQGAVIVVLDQIQDPGNLGAVIRSAHALGAAGVIITKDRSAAMTPAAVRSSAGASELMDVARVTNLARCISRLKEEGITVLGAAGEVDTQLGDLDLTGSIALVLGNEGKGLRRLTKECCDQLYSIPMETSFDSLNISAAAAVSLYEAARQRRA